MIRFIIFLILFFALIGICIYYKKTLGSKLYIAVLSFIIFSFIFGFIFAALDNEDGKIKQDLALKFKIGKILDCKGVKVSNKTHNFNNGTSVFIDKISNEKINIFDCKINE